MENAQSERPAAQEPDTATLPLDIDDCIVPNMQPSTYFEQ
jgi:hypothetical protein